MFRTKYSPLWADFSHKNSRQYENFWNNLSSFMLGKQSKSYPNNGSSSSECVREKMKKSWDKKASRSLGFQLFLSCYFYEKVIIVVTIRIVPLFLALHWWTSLSTFAIGNRSSFLYSRRSIRYSWGSWGLAYCTVLWRLSSFLLALKGLLCLSVWKQSMLHQPTFQVLLYERKLQPNSDDTLGQTEGLEPKTIENWRQMAFSNQVQLGSYTWKTWVTIARKSLNIQYFIAHLLLERQRKAQQTSRHLVTSKEC